MVMNGIAGCQSLLESVNKGHITRDTLQGLETMSSEVLDGSVEIT